MRNMRAMMDALTIELEIGDLPAEVERRIVKGAMADEPHLARDVGSISSYVASRVDAALDPTAREYGWPATSKDAS